MQMRQHLHIKLYIIYIMRLLYILFYTASPQISAIIIFATCLLSYATPIIMRLNHEFLPHKAQFLFFFKNLFFIFLSARPNPQKTALSGGFHTFTKATL